MRWSAVMGVGVGMLLGGHAQAEPSELWGVEGERFDPTGRLMDWSYAGYHHGEDPLPDRPASLEVEDFGAVGDGVADDTAAFTDALAAAEAAGGGVVHVPEGTWVLSARLSLPDGVVLQGEGSGQTILYIPVSLTDVYGNAGLEGGGTSSYSFSGAFIEARGDVDGDPLTSVTASAERGGTAIEVESTAELAVGQWIRVTQTDAGGALIDRLHADLMSGGDDNEGDRGMNFHTRIAGIEGTTLELERALPVDIDPGWSPDVRPVTATVQEAGVEHLTVEFPLTDYPGHFNERGYNAIDMAEVAHAWVRDVEVLNADYAVNIRRSHFVTVSGVLLDTTGSRGNITGHHGLNNGYGGDNLFIGFDIRTTFQHDLTNEWYATGVVFTKGRGDDLRMDHHRAAPYSTLWTELDCGAGDSPFVSGGRSDRGPHTAAYNTLWNVRADGSMSLPADNFGPRMNFVGFQTDAAEATSPHEWWFEALGPDQIEPPNLWEAMVERRLGVDEPGDDTTGGEPTTGGGSETASASDSTGGPSPTSGMVDEGGSGAVPPGGSGVATDGGPAGSAGGSDDDAGCSCRSNGGGAGSVGWMLGFVLCGRRRRTTLHEAHHDHDGRGVS